jgi:hypothetical protein
MRHASLIGPALALSLVSLAGCLGADDSESPDAIDEVGADGGKADGSQLTECESREILAYLNEGVSAEGLKAAGIHERAARSLAAHRDGPDGQFGTDDDDLFDSIDEVDEVAYVGRAAFAQLVAATGPRCQAPVDVYADARDVTKAHVVFAADAPYPTSYQYPSAPGFSLNGTEFWQKWTGGHNPTYSFSEGTDAGRRCMQAAAIRFEAIMADAPEALVQLREGSNWGGSFFNWNDDYSKSEWGDASGPRLWAWRTSLIKWISQTKKDGSCLLPTRDLVIKAANSCLTRGAEIQGCSASL